MIEVKAFAPATIANLSAGFDVLGLSIEGPGDAVVARLNGPPGVRVIDVVGDGGKLPREADRNTAGIAATSVLRKAGIEAGVELIVHKGLPIGSGLGSSAASAAAAATAVNALVGSPLRKRDLVDPCLDAEQAVSGRHADNVAAALLGGLVLVRSVDPLDVVRLPIPEDLRVAVVSPAFELATKEARAVLPASVPLHTMVQFGANLAALVAACFAGDAGLIGRCLVDEVVTPARSKLIPGCDDVLAAALAAGALGSGISGAGPSVFALCRSDAGARAAGKAMQAAFEKAGLKSTLHLSPVDCPGARVL
jgi:homoserine kinase